MADQLEKYFAACKDAGKLYAGMNENVINSYALNRMSSYTFDKGLVGIEKGDNEFKVVDLIQSEQYRFWAEKLAEFYKKGYIRSDIASSPDLSFVKDGVFNANTIIMTTGNDYINTAETESANAGVEISVIRHQNEGTYGKSNSTGMVVPYCADEPERAIMVLNAIYTVPELYQLLIYGIEGVHYTDNGDGTITTPYGSNGTDADDYGIPKWVIGTCKNSLVTQADTPGYYQQLQEQEKTALINKTGGFVFDTTAVEDIIVALSALEEEYYYIFGEGYAGDDWEKLLDEYIAARKEAGIDKYIAECQKQFDAWRKENGYTSWDQIIVEQ